MLGANCQTKECPMSPFTYPYPRPAVSVDCVLLTWRNRRLHTLLIKRDRDPFEGCWALPGGFMDENEDLVSAAARELSEETGLNNVRLNQFRAYGTPNRDPRTRVITVVFWGTLRWESQRLRAGDDAREAQWCDLNQLPPLAFDHQMILGDVLKSLRLRIRSQPFGESLLPPKFPLADLQAIYEDILGIDLHPVEFQQRLGGLPHLQPCPKQETDWQFVTRAYRQLQESGLSFDPQACQSEMDVERQ